MIGCIRCIRPIRGIRFVQAVSIAALTAGPVSAQTPVAPDAAIAAARGAMQDTVRGASLRVVLFTVGIGEQVWERFGHNLLWIQDQQTGQGQVWNWGLFDFDEPGFYQRFLLGNTRYWMEGQDPATELSRYQQLGREVVAQELALTPAQRAALEAFVIVNSQPDHRYYRYDYFVDNCSTRLRDALDIVLGGVLGRALGARSSEPVTYRSEALRLVQHNAALFLGMDLALGTPADARLSDWEAAFIPMRLRDALRDVTVELPDGRTVPLVAREYVAVAGRVEADPTSIAAGPFVALVAVATLLVVTLLLGASAVARRGVLGVRAGIVAVATIVHAVMGITAAVLVLAWAATRHDFWNWNVHLLLATPLSLAVAVLLPGAVRRPARHAWIVRYHVVMSVLSAGVAVAAVFLLGREPGASGRLLLMWANAAWVIYAALFIALSHPGPDGEPHSPDAAAMRMAA